MFKVLFPAMDLLDSLITSLGTDNLTGNQAILHFLLCHGDMVSAVLRDAQRHLPLAARLTTLISRSADIGHIEETSQLMGVHSPHLIRTLMLEMLANCHIAQKNINPASLNHVLQVYLFFLQKFNYFLIFFFK